VDLAARTTDLNVTLADADPKWWDERWPGRVRGSTAVRAALAPLRVAFDAIDVAGVLRGYTLALRGAAEYTAPDRWRLAGARLTSGANRIAVDGELTSNGLELVADVDVRNLDLLWPGLTGAATGKVDIGGSFDAPSGRGQLVGRKLAYRDFKLEQVTVDGRLGGSAVAPLALQLEATGGTNGALRVDRIVAAASGTMGSHRVTLDLAAPAWHSHAEAAGALAARTWRGTLTSAEFDEDVLGRWHLVDPSAVAIGLRQVSFETLCLEHPSAGRWCGALDLRGQPGDRLVLVAQNFDLQTLRPLLPPAVALEGVCQLSASLFDLTGNRRGALALTGEHTRVRATTGEHQTYAADLDELRAAATLVNGRVELLAALRSGDAGRLDLNASIRDVRLANSAIDGKLSLVWPDVGFLTLLAPELAELGGSVAGEVAVGGTVDEPKVDGRATWQGGRVAMNAWGLVIDGIEATAESRGGNAIEFDAKGHVGDGLVTLTGQTALDPNAHWPTRLALHADSVRAVQVPEAEIFVTPDLAATVAWPEVRVTGTIKVPRASLGLSALPARTVAPSADAVIHGRDGPPAARRLQLHAAVDMELGDEVHYSGLDLDTKVTGALHVDVQPNRSAIATGTLTLAGTYDAYGQHLTLERGQLLFTGPLDDPGVDVRAVRTIDTTRVGVELVGTIKSPRTRVFSTPTMSDANALSYLLLGRPMTGTGTEETATLQTAALAMGLNQALPGVQRLGATLGLDELSVQSTATDAGALMAGKYLSPKLYIRYSYGLFNRIGGLLLRFKFNERLSVETRSGDQKSMDLLYTVEKD
jgi:translocation and assembly module TamB